MAFQGILVVVLLCILVALALVPSEIVRNRVDQRLKDLGKRSLGRHKVSWQEDASAICDEHFGNFKFYAQELARMERAGFMEHWQTGAFFLAQVLCLLIGLLVGFAFDLFDVSSWDAALKALLSLVLIALVFVVLPRIWLKLRTSENMKRLRKTMPIAVELMTICMESGNGLEQTFEKVGRELMGTNPQLAKRLLDVRSGMVAYDRKWALEKLERESFFEEEKELARSLLESLRYGTPLVTALRALAQRMREENMNRLEEVAGKASTKMTLPMIIFLLLPVIVIMLAEPVINFLRNW